MNSIGFVCRAAVLTFLICGSASQAQTHKVLAPLGTWKLFDPMSRWHARRPDVRLGLSARAWLANDAERLYAVVEVDDRDNRTAPDCSRLEKFDAISLSFDSNRFDFDDLEVGRAGGHPCQNINSFFTSGAAISPSTDIKLRIERDEKGAHTIYRLSIPLNAHRFPPRRGADFGLRLRVFDRDKKTFRVSSSSSSSDPATWPRFQFAPLPPQLR